VVAEQPAGRVADDGIGAAAGARLAVVSSHLHRFPGDAASCPEKALLLGLAAVIPQEIEGLECRAVDVALPAAGSAGEADLVEDLLAEVGAWGPAAETVVAWRGGVRWVRSFGPAPLGRREGLEGQEGPAGPVPRVRDGGVYLITGGLGGIGLALAAELASLARIKLALLGRSAMPPRETWDAAAAAGDERVRGVRELERLGAQVLTVAADVADEAAVQAAVADPEEPLSGELKVVALHVD